MWLVQIENIETENVADLEKSRGTSKKKMTAKWTPIVLGLEKEDKVFHCL